MRRLALVLAVFCGCASTRPPSTEAPQSASAEVLATFVDDARAGRFGRLDHVIVGQHGRTLVDAEIPVAETGDAPGSVDDAIYDYDDPRWHPYYAGTDLHTMQSMTKSVVSMLVGAAIEDSLIPGTQTPVTHWFPVSESTDARWARATLEDLLTMRSGIDWNESLPYTDPENTCIALEASDDWVGFVLRRPMREEPGTRFDYNSGVSVLLGKILRQSTGEDVPDYARRRLFEPLGIKEFYWKQTPRGETDTEGGLYLSTADQARLAQLMLRRGEWDGVQLIESAWVDASTRPIVDEINPDANTGTGYGYQWWVPSHAPGERFIYAASGYGGQFMIVVPELDAVVVLNAWNHRKTPELSAPAAVVERILPALADSAG